MSSETGAHTSTDLTIPTIFGSINQQISNVNVAAGDADQYSDAGSAAPYVHQYVDIITRSLQNLSSDTIRSLIGYKWLITAIKRSIRIDTSSNQAEITGIQC